jgi:probable DNA metabolism protein
MVYDRSLEGLFAVLEAVSRTVPAVIPVECSDLDLPLFRSQPVSPGFGPKQPELFAEAQSVPPVVQAAVPDSSVEIPMPFDNFGKTPGGIAGELYELSVRAYDEFVYGWMSELPIEGDLIRFAWRVLAVGRAAGKNGSLEARSAAENVLGDRGDPVVEKVLVIGHRVRHEVHRIMGFLRFKPNAQGVYVARCAPDYFILPVLAPHFVQRFGPQAWAIIDEKRGISCVRAAGGEPRLVPWEGTEAQQGPDYWEKLWQGYHRWISNESRSNSALQRQFMPLRYFLLAAPRAAPQGCD